MRLRSIQAKNFRKFKDRSFEFPCDFTLIVGENGSGKSTVVEAIAASLSILADFSTERRGMAGTYSLNEEFIRVERHGVNGTVRFERQTPAYAMALLTHEGRDIQTVSQAGDRQEGAGYTLYREDTRAKVAAGEKVLLPCLAYYGANRLLEEHDVQPARHEV